MSVIVFVAALAFWALAAAMARKAKREMRRLLIAQARAEEEG